VGFEDMGQLMIIYFGFVRYLGGGRDYNEAVHRIQGSLRFSLGGRSCIIFFMSLGSSSNGKANKSV
jgi:hypothetical protein